MREVGSERIRHNATLRRTEVPAFSDGPSLVGNLGSMPEAHDLPHADLVAAADVCELAGNVVGRAVRHRAASGGPDACQVLAYDVSHAAAQLAGARSMLDY